MKRIIPAAIFAAIAPGLPSCNDQYGLLQAKKIEQRGELVGGPVAMADVGDFLLQNDLIKVNILGPKDSPGPGVYGGSIVDIDIRRDRMGFENAQGRDRFAELFPVANLLVPFPKDAVDVSVPKGKDGSDGKEAVVRVEGKGAFLFEALGILRSQKALLDSLFPDVKSVLRFRTDYILRMGERHITIRTTVMRDEDNGDGCPDVSTCAPCENGHVMDPQIGCYSCDCEAPLALEPYTKSESVFGQIFGDYKDDSPVRRSGVVAGDFVFFGNQNAVFAPGIGFDAEKALHAADFAGRNTFQQPLSFDFVSAAGGDVSYAYFTVAPKGSTDPVKINVPIFSGSATAFLAAGKSCLFDPADDAECDDKRAWTFERHLAVGDGDVASVSDEVWKTRGTKTGEIRGTVQWLSTGEPAPKAHVYVFNNPVPGRRWSSVDQLADASLRLTGDYGLVNAIDADVGLDLVLDGDFHATLPPGDYVIVARSEDGMGVSAPQSIHLDAGKTEVVVPAVVSPGTVAYRLYDENGETEPGKAVLVALDAHGQELDGDGTRRVYLGDGRLGNGVRVVDYAPGGSSEIRVEPGRYRFRASRGPEYGIYEQDIVVEPNRVVRVDALVQREVDTTGYVSADMHIHSTPSFDSGMALDKRMGTVVAEHVEFAVPTDHDVETDYGPTIRAMLLEPYVASAVGVETTTIEQGHFIAFPLKYDANIVPTHGSHDPTCETGGEIVSALKASGADKSDEPFTILAHPRDGFFGYMYQLGVDPFTMKRQTGTLEKNNPVFRTATCDFDGMELINGKRFDLVRSPTIAEVLDWNNCRKRIDDASDEKALDGICPEIKKGMFAPCIEGERFVDCRDRNRTALAWESMKRMLIRTPEEQEALWGFSLGMVDGQGLCDLPADPHTPVPPENAEMPCTYYQGHVDDYFRYLEHGMLKTHVASSDSHDDVHEPGYPRTYLKSATDSPGALDVKEVVSSLKAGTGFTTYGPYIAANVDGKSFGEVAKIKPGKATLDLSVQTASWFGVDRIEIYSNGHLVNVISPKSKPEDIVDWQGKVDIDVPEGRDSWIVIIAMGLEDQNLMRKVTRDISFGEIQISRVTSQAFSLVPVVNSIFKPTPTLPDWFPIPPYAVSNPIYLDTDGNGKYDAPLPFPEFCSKPCDPAATEDICGNDQFCLPEELQCGVAVLGNQCEHRIPWPGGDHPGGL